MPSAPTVARGFFPLDRRLGLLPGGLAPHIHEKMVRLGSWMPFEPAVQLLEAFTGVSISKSTGRRMTELAGAKLVEQQEQRVIAMEAGEVEEPKTVAQRLVLSVDGAMVPLVGGDWAEVRTMVIGEASSNTVQERKPEKRTGNHSYFSRLTDSTTFQRAALAETERRGLYHASQVAAVNDGAEWIQQFIDYHRPDAVRILDFPHAAERFTSIYQTCQEEGVTLPAEWPAQQRHRLKEEGGTAVLNDLQKLQKDNPEVGLDEPLTYLRKREQMLQYPHFQQAGWPIGSGIVESANKLVVEARLKGSGMHWHPSQVNPMLALRNVVCNNRWEETWPTIITGFSQSRPKEPVMVNVKADEPGPNPVREYYKQMQKLYWQQKKEDKKSAPKKKWKPAPDHPWRRNLFRR